MTIKTSISGAIGDTLTAPVAGDHYGAQILSVEFFDDEDLTIPATVTSGSYSLQWSPNGSEWIDFEGIKPPIPYDQAVGDWQASGYIDSVRCVPDSIVGASYWSVTFRAHKFGLPGISGGLISRLAFRDRLRTVTQSQLETVISEGDGYRFSVVFGNGDSNATGVTMINQFPAIPANGSVFLSIKYSTTNTTALLSRQLTVESGSGLRYYAYVPGSAIVPSASPITIGKLSNGSPKTAALTAYYDGTTQPAHLTGGTQIDYSLLPDSGGGQGSSGGQLLRDDSFLLIAPGSETIVEIHNPNNASVIVLFGLQIAELPI